MRLLLCFGIGLLFGLGIAISGMVNPAKVLNFFDVAGHWDPSLIFVMGGALSVTFLGYRLILKRPSPLFADAFQVPTRRNLDLKLIGGSALFGVGWGLAGFCPGGALPALSSGKIDVFVFVVSVGFGIVATRLLSRPPQNEKKTLATSS